MKEIEVTLTVKVWGDKTETEIEDYIIDLIHNQNKNYRINNDFITEIKYIKND